MAMGSPSVPTTGLDGWPWQGGARHLDRASERCPNETAPLYDVQIMDIND